MSDVSNDTMAIRMSYSKVFFNWVNFDVFVRFLLVNIQEDELRFHSYSRIYWKAAR